MYFDDFVFFFCVQVITPSGLSLVPLSGVEGFGWSLSGGSDTDGNSYTDMVVGAATSNHVFVLRARPVLLVTLETM